MKKYFKYIYATFAVGLTFLSMQSGFYFYRILFELRTAILATGVFEILRLSALLYLSLNLETRKKTVAAILYVTVAFICAFAATSSFHARIIESHERDYAPYRSQLEDRVNVIQQKYAQIYARKILDVEERLDISRKRTITLPNSTYWPQRVEQLMHERHAIIAERDSVITSVPSENIEGWIHQHAAIVGVTFEPLPLANLGATAITTAIRELWDIGELGVKKLVALAITLAIEIGIVLLAIFARIYAAETAAAAAAEARLAAAEAAENETEKLAGQSFKALPSSTTGLSYEKRSSHIGNVQNNERSNGREELLSEPQNQPLNEPLSQPNRDRHQQFSADEPQGQAESSPEVEPSEVEPMIKDDLQTAAAEKTPESSGENISPGVESKEAGEILTAELPESQESPREDQENGQTQADVKRDITYRVMKKLRAEFREEDIQSFLKMNARFFSENQKLIPTSRLTRKLQPIRRTLNKEFTQEELQMFLNHREETTSEV